MTNLEGDKLVEVSMKVGSIAKSARVIYGVVRDGVEWPSPYITIATGLSVGKVFEKLKDKATETALRHSEKMNIKTSKILENKEDKILDV
jgi:hypothetical protein